MEKFKKKHRKVFCRISKKKKNGNEIQFSPRKMELQAFSIFHPVYDSVEYS
jgi:mRNA degradation ribonuclease J1/J2